MSAQGGGTTFNFDRWLVVHATQVCASLVLFGNEACTLDCDAGRHCSALGPCLAKSPKSIRNWVQHSPKLDRIPFEPMPRIGARGGPISTKFGAISAGIGRTRPGIGQIWADLGRLGPNSAEACPASNRCGPNSIEFGTSSANVDDRIGARSSVRFGAVERR